MTEQNINENKDAVEQDKNRMLPFVTEEDVFEVSVKYYFKDKECFVENITDGFDATNKDITDLTCTLKYPSQGDITLISSRITAFKLNQEEIDLKDFYNVEFIRFLVLVRKWNVDATLNNENALRLHPRIVKALLLKIRDVIHLDAII